PLGNLASEMSDVHEGFRERLASVFPVWRERLTLALRDAQRRGDVGNDCRVETVAQFLVASLEGAILMTKVSKDIGVMQKCVGELKRYLAIYEQARPLTWSTAPGWMPMPTSSQRSVVTWPVRWIGSWSGTRTGSTAWPCESPARERTLRKWS